MLFSNYTDKEIEQTAAELKTSVDLGLSQAEAELRLKKNGLNSLMSKTIGWQDILVRQFTSPFIYLLFVASAITLFLNDIIEGLIILFFVLLNATLGFIQEYRSEQALKLLRSYIIRQVRVVRDGGEKMVDSQNLAPGDLVILQTGDIVPADLRLIEEVDFVADESVLSGESLPIKKSLASLGQSISEIFKASNIAFAGTAVASGWAKGLVLATGNQTVMGETAKLTSEVAKVSSFEKNIFRFSRFILRLIVITLVFVFLANLLIKGESADFFELLVFSIALAVSVIPEALPLVTTFSLSKGALHLAKKKVVVKRLSAIEDLGSMEVLCTDKTGTLTENILSVNQVLTVGRDDVLFYASLAAPFLAEKKKEPNNAFDLALWKAVTPESKKLILGQKRLKEIPFDPEKRRNAVLLQNQNKMELVVRGAFEELIKLCLLTDRKKLNYYNDWLAKQGRLGRRVIAVAKKSVKVLPEEDLSLLEKDLSLVGLISFSDPIKKSVAESVREAQELGVIIKILTGDAPEVAGAVAYQVGLAEYPEAVITGAEFEAGDEEKQKEILEHYSVFARVSPLQKYKIVKLLQQKYQVGFLGEGINDAPALKAANIALVVQGAADIAREAADIVLLKKSLQVIVEGIGEGRAIFVNSLKYIKATLISNFGNFFAIAIALMISSFLPMLPLQLLLLNLLSDFPMISIATDHVDRKEVGSPKAYDFKDVLIICLTLGLVSTIFDFIFFGLFYRHGESILQTNWFIASVLTELVLLFSIRTKFFFTKGAKPSTLVMVLSLAAFGGALLIPLTALGQRVFGFSRPQPGHLLLIAGITLVYFAVTEAVKYFYNRYFPQASRPVVKRAAVAIKNN